MVLTNLDKENQLIMSFDYINEAFKKLNVLEESVFNLSMDGIEDLKSSLESDDTEEVVTVIDPTVKTEDELSDSYVGKVIVKCNVCNSYVFNDKEDIIISEEGSVNIEENCPYCGEEEGFVIVGEIAPFTVDTQDDINNEESEDTDFNNDASEESIDNSVVEVDDDNNMDEKMSRATRRVMQEDFKEVSITTEDQHMEMTTDDNGKVTVTTEVISEETDETKEEVIAPVSPEVESEILSNNNIEDTSEDAVPEEEDVDFDEIDEESFDELGESFLRNVYENVESFKTTDVSSTNSSLIVEGIIKFTSGMNKKTGFIFEAKDVNSNGKVRFSGANKHFCESADAFSLVGCVDNKKLILESLKYNYTTNSTSVRGVARRK